MKYYTDIGIEVHVRLNTTTKMFSRASTDFGEAPNSQVAGVDFGLPGTLPIINQQAVTQAIIFGLSCSGTINPFVEFARKHYFYPDLPKGYQTSQFKNPIVSNGFLNINSETDGHQVVRIERAHLEEDAGKSMHLSSQSKSLVDYNRAGQPLLEIVTHPDIHSLDAAICYLKTLHNLVQYLGICDGNMQEGSFRCDINLSIRRSTDDPLGTRVELKNLNSFKFIEKAIAYEYNRQCKSLDKSVPIRQETRLYDETTNKTFPMRSKEESPDYRYMPDPDLPVIRLEQTDIDQIKAAVPELPWVKQDRYMKEYELSDYDAKILSHNRPLSEYFETVIKHCDAKTKTIANWLIVELLALSNKHSVAFEKIHIHSKDFADLINQIESGVINGKIAKSVLAEMWDSGDTPISIIESKGLSQITDNDEILRVIQGVIEENGEQLSQYKSGKTQLLGYFVGQVMKKTQGKANPKIVNKMIQQCLNQT